MRAAWRLESGDPEQARVALELLDALILLEGEAEDLISRARAAALSGHPRIAMLDLSEVVATLEQSRSQGRRDEISRLARSALQALNEFPDDPLRRVEREEQRRRLRVILTTAASRR